jgi:hypothetical protein
MAEQERVALPDMVAQIMDERLSDPRASAEQTAQQVLEQLDAVRESMAATMEQVSQMSAEFTKAAKLLAAPKEVVRDEKGRAIRVQVVA